MHLQQPDQVVLHPRTGAIGELEGVLKVTPFSHKWRALQHTLKLTNSTSAWLQHHLV